MDSLQKSYFRNSMTLEHLFTNLISVFSNSCCSKIDNHRLIKQNLQCLGVLIQGYIKWQILMVYQQRCVRNLKKNIFKQSCLKINLTVSTPPQDQRERPNQKIKQVMINYNQYESRYTLGLFLPPDLKISKIYCL